MRINSEALCTHETWRSGNGAVLDKADGPALHPSRARPPQIDVMRARPWAYLTRSHPIPPAMCTIPVAPYS